MDIPKVSVIIPIYNVEDYLEETLKNIANQTFIDYLEVLMIDDGSTDNSRYIVEKYALDYDNFYAFHKENGGQCVARNFALLIARGEYIHFMDSDDFITNDAYEKLYNFAKNGNYDVVTFNYLRFDNNSTWKVASQLNVFDELCGNVENTNVFDFKELSWDMTNCNKLVRKKLLDEYNIKYYYKNIIYEDNLFWIEVYINAKRIAVLKDYIYFWRYRENLSSTTQIRDLDLGKRFSEMVYLVNDFITHNISDKEVLAKKYEKLLSINLYFFMKSVLDYPKENQEQLFNDAYDMLKIVPQEYLDTLNSYFRVIYSMVNNKDWDNLSLFLSKYFNVNPVLPKKLDQKYVEMIDFNKDSHSERLSSLATNIFLEDNNIMIDFKIFVPFNHKNNFDKIDFKLLNNEYEDILLDSDLIRDNKLKIPLNLINPGEYNIFTSYYFDDIKKEAYMKIKNSKTFIFDDFDISIKCGPDNLLRLIKRKKNNINLKISRITLSEDIFHFYGEINGQLENILLTDYLGIVQFEYPINIFSENKFSFEINYDDFIKAPITKWEISSSSEFNSMELSEDYEFLDNMYAIYMKNQDNCVFVQFELYNMLNKIHNLNEENKKIKSLNSRLSVVNNKLLSSLSNSDRICVWEDVNNSVELSNYSMFNGKFGILTIVEDYKQLTVTISDPTVVRVFSSPFSGDFEIRLEIKVTDYANIGISSMEDVLNFAFLRISNTDWSYYRFLRINGVIFLYVSEDGVHWNSIKLTGNTLNSDECQFQFNCGYSNASDKRLMIRNIQIYKL